MSLYINILENGSFVHTNWKRDIGDTCAIPGSKPVKYSTVKFSLTQNQYEHTVILKNRIVKSYFDFKNKVINNQRVFSPEIKSTFLLKIFKEISIEQFSSEAFLLATPQFN